MFRLLTTFLTWLMSASLAFAVIHTHTTLQSCVVTIGSFCPVESVGFSVLGTAILTLFFGGGRWLLGLFGQRGNQERLRENREDVLARARDYFREGNSRAVIELLTPYMQIGDPAARALIARISEIENIGQACAAAIGEKDYDRAISMLSPIADTGVQQYIRILGKLFIATNRHMMGLKWLAVAASRGDSEAKRELDEWQSHISLEENVEIKAFLSEWQRAFKQRVDGGIL